MREFAEQHFGERHRRVLLVGGAGFDPRTLCVGGTLAGFLGDRLDVLFLRETRPSPDADQRARAERQLADLRTLSPRCQVAEVEVFDLDGAVVLGRGAVELVGQLDLDRFTDVVVDFSALSIGASFPITKLLFERLEVVDSAGTRPERTNLHAFVTASPSTDGRIVPRPSDKVGPVHGFRGRLDLDETARAARLWIPQLRMEVGGTLKRIFGYLAGGRYDVVPALPFPSEDPRLGDRLLAHYREEFDGWEVDPRNIVYVAESDPLDFYRTILQIDDQRRPVFAETGGSLVVLSPVGTKVVALGALMAALERDFPVVYVEALSFAANLDAPAHCEYTDDDLVHVWLTGEAYPRPVSTKSSAAR